MAQELALLMDHHAMPQKGLQEQGQPKVWLIVASDYKGILVCALAVGMTVNAAYYRTFVEHG
jgi:hypothetical protein